MRRHGRDSPVPKTPAAGGLLPLLHAGLVPLFPALGFRCERWGHGCADRLPAYLQSAVTLRRNTRRLQLHAGIQNLLLPLLSPPGLTRGLFFLGNPLAAVTGWAAMLSRRQAAAGTGGRFWGSPGGCRLVPELQQQHAFKGSQE